MKVNRIITAVFYSLHPSPIPSLVDVDEPCPGSSASGHSKFQAKMIFFYWTMVKNFFFFKTMTGFGELSPVVSPLDRNFPSSNLSLVLESWSPGQSYSNIILNFTIKFSCATSLRHSTPASSWIRVLKHVVQVYNIYWSRNIEDENSKPVQVCQCHAPSLPRLLGKSSRL